MASIPHLQLYTKLSVPRVASISDLQKAYKRQCMIYHPDHNTRERVSSRVVKPTAGQSIIVAYQALTEQKARVAYDIFTCARCDGCLLGDRLDGVITDEKNIHIALKAFSPDDILEYCTLGHALTKHKHYMAWRVIPESGNHVPSYPQGEFYVNGPHMACDECREGGELRVVANSVCFDCVAYLNAQGERNQEVNFGLPVWSPSTTPAELLTDPAPAQRVTSNEADDPHDNGQTEGDRHELPPCHDNPFGKKSSPHATVSLEQLLNRGLQLIEKIGQESEGCAILLEALAKKPAYGMPVANVCTCQARKLLDRMAEHSGAANDSELTTVLDLLNAAERGLRALEELGIELAFREPRHDAREIDLLSDTRPLVERYVRFADILSTHKVQMALVQKVLIIVEQLTRDFPCCQSDEFKSTYVDIAMRVAVEDSMSEPTILDEPKLEAMDNQVAAEEPYLKRFEVPMDGLCIFKAVCVGMMAQGKPYHGGLRRLMDDTWLQVRTHTSWYSVEGDLEGRLETLIAQYEERNFNHILADRVIMILSDVLDVDIVVYAPFLPVEHAQRFSPKEGTRGRLCPLHLRFNGVNHYDAYIPSNAVAQLHQKETSAQSLDKTATQILKYLAEGKVDAAKETYWDRAPGRPWDDRTPFAPVLELSHRALQKWPLLGHVHYVRALALQHSNGKGDSAEVLTAAKEALLIGVELRLQPRLYRTIAKACFDGEDWAGAFLWYSKCAKEGYLRAEDSVFLDVSRIRQNAQGGVKVEEVAERVFELLSEPPAEELLAEFDAIADELALASEVEIGSGSDFDWEEEAEPNPFEPSFHQGNAPEGRSGRGSGGKRRVPEGPPKEFVQIDSSSEEEEGKSGQQQRRIAASAGVKT